jgi:hypothetical protein
MDATVRSIRSSNLYYGMIIRRGLVIGRYGAAYGKTGRAGLKVEQYAV